MPLVLKYKQTTNKTKSLTMEFKD